MLTRLAATAALLVLTASTALAAPAYRSYA